MKKTIVLLFALLVVSSLVLAQEGHNDAISKNGAMNSPGPEDGAGPVVTAVPIMANEGYMVQTKEKLKEMYQVHQGLENAMNQVQNENAKQMLEQNMEKFQEKFQVRLQKMEQVEVKEMNEETGEMKIKAKEKVKFLGFINGKASKQFEVGADGEVTEKKPWYRFLYKEVKQEEVVAEE
ncbi:hypothetical protein ACFLTH_08460 [Bacteroidota bacterium]